MNEKDKRRQMSEIAKRIEEYVGYAGKTLHQVSQEMGLHEDSLYTYTNRLSVPSVLILKRLCKVLDCTYEDILGQPE